MKVTETKESIIIELPKNAKPTLTPSSKSYMVATSHGNTPTGLQLDGHVLIAGVNVFYKNPKYVKPTS